MSFRTDVVKAIRDFETGNPSYKNKVVLTSGSRTWESQLKIILQPKRVGNYKNIKSRFLKKFSLVQLPTSVGGLSKQQLNWWKTEILKQAGRSPGFPHVGGRAQDVSVKRLFLPGKRLLKSSLEAAGFSVLLELITNNKSEFGVSIGKANTFHIYK